MKTLVCRIELDKKKGIILTVENESKQITQTIVMDGQKIETIVKGSDNTSTITQNKDGIAIHCKAFKLNAETIDCTSIKTTHLESGDNLEITGKKDLTASVQNNAGLSAMNVTIGGKVTTKIDGTKLELSGKENADLNSALVKIDSTGILDLISSGMVNIEGSAINTKGPVNNG